MQVTVLNTSGKSKGKISLPNEMFSCQFNSKLLAQAVRVYLSNQRQKTAKVKTRGEVRGSRIKIWRQKGTGRARHGDRYAPIFVGGGIAHGPTGKENVKLKFSKKMRRKALFIALSKKVKDSQTIFVDGLEKLEPKTKTVNDTLQNLVNTQKNKKPIKASIITSSNAETFVRGARNIKGVKILTPEKLNAYEIINSRALIVMKDAVKQMEKTFLGKKPKPIKKIKKTNKVTITKKQSNNKITKPAAKKTVKKKQ